MAGLGPILPIQTTITLDTNQFSRAVEGLSQQLGGLEAKMSKSSSSIGAGVSSGITNPMGAAFGAVTKLAGALGVGYLISRVVDVNAAFSRMDTMTNYNRTMTTITGSADIAKASLESLKQVTLGTAYGLDVAAKATQGFVTRGMDMGNATNQVRVWADAVSFYGSGTNEALANTIDAWQNMYARGKVTMVQLNRVLQDGIPVIDIYAKATKTSTAKVMEAMSKEGLTATQVMSVVTKAMSEGTNGVLNIAGAAKEAGNTWATTFANMKAAATRGIISVIEAIDAGLEKAGAGSVMGNLKSIGASIENVFKQIAENVTPIVLDIINAVKWLKDNLIQMAPVLGAVAVAMALYGTATRIAAVYVGIYNTAKAICAARTMLATTATFAQTAAQHGLNAAMLASPVTWVIVGIMALIGVIFLVVAAINKWTGKTYSAVGVIAGAFTWLGATVLNIAIGAINGIIQAVFTVIEPIISVFEWILNIAKGGFDNFGAGVANLIGNIIGWFLTLGTVVTKIIDAIFGTDWTGGLNKLKGQVTSWGKNESAITLSREAPAISRVSAMGAYNTGYGFGKGLAKVFTGTSATAGSSAEDNNFGGMPSSLSNIDDNTSKMAKGLKNYTEEVKYIMDYATRKATHDLMAQRAVVIDMKGSNFELKSDVDINDLADMLGRRVLDRIGA